MLGSECKTLEQVAAKRSSRGLRHWLCPVYAEHVRPVMPSERVLFIQAFDDNAGMKEGASKESQRRG